MRALCAAALAFTLFYIFTLPPPEFVVQGDLWDKLVHSVVWAGMAFLAWAAAAGRRPLAIFVALCVVGVLDEVNQHFTPGRDAGLLDVAADALGAAVAIAVLRALQRQGSAGGGGGGGPC